LHRQRLARLAAREKHRAQFSAVEFTAARHGLAGPWRYEPLWRAGAFQLIEDFQIDDDRAARRSAAVVGRGWSSRIQSGA
jgi:hypothetical protein